MRDLIFTIDGATIRGYFLSIDGGNLLLNLRRSGNLAIYKDIAGVSDEMIYCDHPDEFFQDIDHPTDAERTLFELEFNLPYPPQDLLDTLSAQTT